MTAFDYVMRNGGANFTPPGPSHRRLQTASSADAVSINAAFPHGNQCALFAPCTTLRPGNATAQQQLQGSGVCLILPISRKASEHS